ncbi:hypothetical protein AB0395_41700 [Streptosporangium sp. NPDC051023]|uniref:hypothetical protein n=1 Tax=Streptosporangium sp. NPDC051023 TaxID=3155410 RepID=UPI00344DE5C1
MIGQPRNPGRHRAGQERIPVYQRLWDGPARAEAERLERSHPGWAVLYGVGSRHFYAFAAWPAPEPLILRDSTPEGLEKRMCEEQAVHASADLFPAVLDRQRQAVVPAPREPVTL